ncbi:hypothetical protein [Mesorhizobium sp. ANAO-SY3R2]|uniref:hypothetical protein n=1 Tax=Mesorhizobium sp. ANAO-SY3R2 TaxID=3166644 RepID=UPI0036706F45
MAAPDPASQDVIRFSREAELKLRIVFAANRFGYAGRALIITGPPPAKELVVGSVVKCGAFSRRANLRYPLRTPCGDQSVTSSEINGSFWGRLEADFLKVSREFGWWA